PTFGRAKRAGAPFGVGTAAPSARFARGGGRSFERERAGAAEPLRTIPTHDRWARFPRAQPQFERASCAGTAALRSAGAARVTARGGRPAFALGTGAADGFAAAGAAPRWRRGTGGRPLHGRRHRRPQGPGTA